MKIVGVITGVIMCILGIYAFAVPFRTFLGLGWAVGFLIAVHGIEMLIMEFSKKKKEIGKCVLSILVVLLGCVLLFSNLQRFLTDMMIAYMAGFSVLIYGIYQIIKGAGGYKEKKASGILTIVIGVLSVICGVLLVIHPVFTMLSLGYVIAFAVLMQGIDMIILTLNSGKKDLDN